jgi:hypothetical protein
MILSGGIMEVGDKVVYTYNISNIEPRLLQRPQGVIIAMSNDKDIVACNWAPKNGKEFYWVTRKCFIKQIK